MPSLPDEHIFELGRITANFSALETSMDTLLIGLISPHQKIGQIISAQLSFNRKLNTIWTLVEEQTNDESLLETTREALNKAKSVNDDRNRIVHSGWIIEDETEAVHRVKWTARKSSGLKTQVEEQDSNDLAEIADDLKEAVNGLKEVMRLLERKLDNYYLPHKKD